MERIKLQSFSLVFLKCVYALCIIRICIYIQYSTHTCGLLGLEAHRSFMSSPLGSSSNKYEFSFFLSQLKDIIYGDKDEGWELCIYI